MLGLETSGFARAAYARYFTRESTVTAALADLPAAGFTLNAGQLDMNAAILSGGFDFKVTDRASVGFQVDAEISQSEFMIIGGARVRFSF